MLHAQAKQRLLSDQEHILWSTHQALNQSQVHESSLQRTVAELQALQQTTALRVTPKLSLSSSVWPSVECGQVGVLNVGGWLGRTLHR